MKTHQSARKFYRRRVIIEVLSEDTPVSSELTLADLEYAFTEGDCSASVKWESAVELDGKQAVKALRAQGSDPSFFRLDNKGQEDQS